MAQDEGIHRVEQPVNVFGDRVEYFTEKKEVTAVGNVSVDYKGTKLRCNKLTVNTETKDATAEGDVYIEDESGIMQGKEIIYNFNTKQGRVIQADFWSLPYFGKSEEIQKVGDKKFISLRGYATTCNLNHPHYRLKAQKVIVIPEDKIQTKQDTLFIAQTPVMYLPYYNHSLKEPLMHVQLIPGHSKAWGTYLLSGWRYSLTDNISGRIYLDYRERRGVASGFGANFRSKDLGKGDGKFYYTQERPRRQFQEDQPGEFERYFLRLRHQWDIDERNNLISEYYKIVDSKRILMGTKYNVLKDYFPREYEKDSLPLSYSLLHHCFNHSSMDVLVVKRINRWYSQLEKLPEIRYSLPSIQIAELPLYFENNTQVANFNKKNPVPSPSWLDVSLIRLDTFNKVSLPTKISFIDLIPFVGMQQTYYDKDINNASISPRTVFYTGTQSSTKFYRIFDVKTGFLGLDINGLRHIITPSISYVYNHHPTVPSYKLKQIDSIDAISGNNSASLELSNKLQTKRKSQTIDIANFKINTNYNYKPKGRGGSSFGDFLFDLELIPYSWLRIDADATYKHSGASSDKGYKRFSNANYNLSFNLAKKGSISIGQRYERKGGNELTFNSDWRLSPKWKFKVYERYQIKKMANRNQGLIKQEYSLCRDLHCWLFDITYSVERQYGETIWCIFRLKAFPEAEIQYSQSYHQPKPGSQSY